MGASFAYLTFFASQTLHKVRCVGILACTKVLLTSIQMAIQRVMHAPMSFFETTVCLFIYNTYILLTSSQPLGRIMNRFSKGISDFLFGEAKFLIVSIGRR
jgi:hypothetical protein